MLRRGRKESSVQTAAIDWLHHHYYNERAGIIKVSSRREARLKRNHRRYRGRADGLIAARSQDGTIYVASIEAKSTKTRLQVRPK